MLIIFYILLSFGVGRSTDELFFGTKSLGIGDDVTLTCPRLTSELEATLYWIRIVSGNLPEFLGGTFTFDYGGVNKTPHITAKQGPGTFTLEISQAKLNDSGLYYCIKVDQLDMEFLNATFLKINGPDPAITDIIQLPQSGPLHPGDPVTLQCSVLSNSKKKTCPGNHRVFWFSPGADKSHPNLIYADENSCERSPEASSTQKCVYSFSKNVSSSDAGSYYCAVATCGQILFGNGTKLDIKAFSMWDLQKANTALSLLSAALATSLIVIASLIYIIKKKTCNCCFTLLVCFKQTDVGTISGDQQSQQKVEDSVVYSAATFTWNKTTKVPQRSSRQAEKETIYSDVSVTDK
ncbi:signal-regulatory protein beta-2-like [Archocentrus centrarchus]|uniref:signal-regulatory protein beta-2-like n=1 Tax=Archocentrus centrarchus TaxID=63155 RepID=UPI0011EA3A3D|nr:signal-regulatory protein beta-2-like [Archocentrus centrarchus]